MKKLLDSKFLFILALSIIVLIILSVGAFYLFDDSDATFVKDGYVLNPLSSKSEKYFFNEDASYKENLNQMIVFDDADKNEVKVLKDSFLHYMDGSLSFLKNGAILDLDSIKGTEAVKFYNITSKSIINKKSNGYIIENDGDNIELKDFIGRISDNKYIVVGTLEAKIPGNEKNISGDYFEIVYTDEGVVNIENKDIKYQVAAQGSYIYVGDIVIDLGDKKITKGNEDVMSITAITINGDENIEIIPKAPDKEDENGNGNGDGAGESTDVQNQDGNGGNGENGEGGDQTQKQEVLTEELKVVLENSYFDSTTITVDFDVLNAREDDLLTLKVTDLSTGRLVNEVVDIANKGEIPITLLSPENKYLFTVVNDRNQEKYFQKIFETNSFGIGLEKSYATSSEIGYKINIAAGGNVKNAKLTLKKYNEQSNELETVSSYQLKDVIDMTEGEHDGIIFSGLDSDTIYTAVLDSFSVASTNFNDIYNVTLTSMTLKETPTFGSMLGEATNNSFKLSIDNVVDPDNAITGYTYRIYNANDTEYQNVVIPEIVKTSASPVEIMIGNGEDELDVGTNYVYKLAIEYYDNEKYIEYMMDGSINLYKGIDPYVVIADGEVLSYDKFEAKIRLYDNSCLIDIPGKCNISENVENDSIKVMVYEQGVMQNERFLREYTGDNLVFSKNEDGSYEATLLVDNLNRGTTYSIYVMAKRNDKPTEDFKPLLGTDDNNLFKTKYLRSFEAEWENEAGTREKPIILDVQLKELENNYAVSAKETLDKIKAVVFKIYDGEFNNNLAEQRFLAASAPIIKSDDVDFNELFYENAYNITLENTFGLTKAELETLTGNEDGLLSQFYTIVMEAYFDYEMSEKNAVVITKAENTYHVSPESRDIILSDPTLEIDVIKKTENDYFDNSLTNGLIVGYTLTADFNEEDFAKSELTPQDINFYVYDDSGNQVNFYVLVDDQLKLFNKYSASLGNDGYKKINIYMGYGTNDENIMTRGKKYYVGFDITYTMPDGNLAPPYPSNENVSVPARFGLFKDIDQEVEAKDKAVKDQPNIKYSYIEETTKDGKVTYKYEITDIDNSIVKTDDYYIYYNVNDEYKDKIKLTSAEAIQTSGSINGVINVYRGEFTLSDLNKNDGYTLFYKAIIDSNGEIIEKSIGTENRLFEGYYNDADYNFKFEINPNITNVDIVRNNKVTIKILAEDEMLTRILGYKITFADSKGNVYNNLDTPIWDYDLVMCDDALPGDMPRCYNVDYLTLKNAGMKTEGNNLNMITVSVKALYDNGLTGYGYEDNIGEGKEFAYMIMQENSSKQELGKYYIINNGSLRKSAINYPYGYYTFSINDRWLNYNSIYNPRNKGTFELRYSSDGLGVLAGVMNPKMLSSNMMSSETDKNKFSFSSITPTIKENDPISLINGARINLTLRGADPDDICIRNDGNGCSTGNGKRYLYVDIWQTEDDALDSSKSPIDTVEIELRNDSINGVYDKDIFNLLHNETYYYTVYTYLNNNGVKQKTILFDEDLKDETKVYSFDTKKLLEIFDVNKLAVDVIPNEEGEYNDKLLDTSFTLNKYDSTEDIPFNFDVSYVLCNLNETCNLDNNLLKREIVQGEDGITFVNNPDNITIDDLTDITSKLANGEITLGEDYRLKFFITYNSYGGVSKSFELYEKTVLGDLQLDDIKFTVYRTADYIATDDDYVIDLTVILSDNDRLLLGGNYYVELTDGNNNLVGNLQLKSNEGIYQIVASNEYNTYAIKAKDTQTIRIGGLEHDTLYTVKVYGYSYIDDTETKIVSGEEGTGHRVYSSNNYGVAFGNSVLYTYASSGDNTIVANFGYGSHLQENANITSVTYTIKRDGSTLPPYSNTLLIDEEIAFQQYAGTDNLILVFNIDPNEFLINKGDQYIFTTSYTVYDEVNDREDVIDYTTYSSLSGKVANYSVNQNNG